MINKCNCHSPYQDKRYGKGMRVFNQKGKGSKVGGVARCTVCGYILQDTSGVVNRAAYRTEEPI